MADIEAFLSSGFFLDERHLQMFLIVYHHSRRFFFHVDLLFRSLAVVYEAEKN